MNIKNKQIVSEKAIRELVREALDGNHLGNAPTFQEQLPVVVNSVVDPSASATDPINQNFTPQSKQEFQVSMQQIAKKISIDDLADIYKTILTVVDEFDTKNTEEKIMKKKLSVEETVRRAVRRIISEISPKFDTSYSGTDYGDSDDDDDDLDDGPKRTYKSTALGNMADVDGTSFEEIAKDLGFSVAGAKQAVDKALEKARFIGTLENDDKEIIVLTAMNDYIKMLNKTGSLSSADVQLMKDHPDIVRELDGFREFLHNHIRRARKGAALENPLGESLKKKTMRKLIVLNVKAQEKLDLMVTSARAKNVNFVLVTVK